MADAERTRRYSFVVRLELRAGTGHSDADWEGAVELVPFGPGALSAERYPPLRFCSLDSLPARIQQLIEATVDEG